MAKAARAVPATFPPTAYAWAHLIVRAQKRTSPAMLARHLRLTPEVAGSLFDQLISDGVLRAPGAAGVARAVSPLDLTARKVARRSGLRQEIRRALDSTQDEPDPLAIPEESGVGCAEEPQAPEDHADESSCKSAQESTREG